MSLDLVDLDAETRGAMLTELDGDVEAGSLYLSARLTTQGRGVYPVLLRQAVQDGDDSTLASALLQGHAIRSHEVATRGTTTYTKAVPRDAHITLAEGEFNRFYIRGLCSVVLGLGGREVEVYRAKPVRVARSASQRLLGVRIDAAVLLEDLRTSPGVDTVLGLPPGPNSGLSVRHPVD